jgi:uncharacterized protein YlxW (UPF0749 family)
MSDFDVTGASRLQYSRSNATFETEATRLQREIDHFTHKLEQERRKMITNDEQIKRASEDLRAKLARSK